MPVILKKNYPRPTGDVQAEIFRRLGAGEAETFLYIVPTKRKLRDARREFLQEVPGGIAPSFHLFTLETLAAQLFSLLCPPRRIVAGPAQSVLVNEAVHSLRGELRYFRIPVSNKLPRGTLQKIVDLINTFKEKGVYLPVLYDELEASQPGEQLKLRDILAMYEAYETKLGDRFVDPAGMLKHVNAAWEPVKSPEIVGAHFGGVDTIFVSGFDEFSDPELTMLHNLSELPGKGMLVAFDYHHANEEIFGHLRENYQKFLQMGFGHSSAASGKRPTFDEHVRHHLFSRDAKPGRGAPRFNCRETVTVLSVRDREQEVETVAKLIKRLVRERPDRDLSRICVAAYRPQVYSQLFRETFERFGIPANVTDRYSLDQSPFVVSLLSLLDVQERNFRLRDIMRALSSPYFLISSGDSVVNAGNLYEIGARLKVRGGRSAWNKRIEQEIASVRREIADAGGGAGDFDETQLRRKEALLRRALRDVESLALLLKRFERAMTPAQFKEGILGLLRDLRAVECLLNVSPETLGYDQIEKDTRAYQKFMEFLDEFLEILALERGGSIREPLSFYIDRLRAAISEVRYNVRQKYGYGVVVTSFDETRGLRFEVMVIVGLVDGEFPPAYQPEIFFSAARREREERYHLTESRYLFYQALTNHSDHLYLTLPRYDGDTPLVPSPFVDAFLHIAEPEDLREKLPAALTDPIYSEHDLLERLGAAEGEEGALIPVLPGVRGPLLECIDRMRHAAAVERSRRTRSGMSEYNGRILESLSPEHRAALEELRNGIYSVTQLESYGRCPFQYFAQRILRLNVIPEIEEGVSPLERGGILHEILFDFYVGRRNRSLPPLFACDESSFQEALLELQEIAGRRLGELDALGDAFWEFDKESILGSAHQKGILKELLEMERRTELKVDPAYFEVMFGSRPGPGEHADPLLGLEQPLTAGGVRLRGKIDRIDVGERSFRIIDYKSGAVIPGRQDIDLGVSLQLPLYLHAVEQILASADGTSRTGAAGIYYRLAGPVDSKLGLGSKEHLKEAFHARPQRQLVETDAELKGIVDRAIRFVNGYVDQIAQGEFPVEPKVPKDVCPYCSYGAVCRISGIGPGPNATAEAG